MRQTIDAMGDRNGTLELFEIILYMQEHYQHIFTHKDVGNTKRQSRVDLLTWLCL